MSYSFDRARRASLLAAARMRPPLAALALLAGLSPAAHALPSFARQTGQECAACHVGAYGPQLTPYGVAFKIGRASCRERV